MTGNGIWQSMLAMALGLVSILIASQAQAQPNYEWKVDKQELTIGEHLFYFVEITQLSGSEPKLLSPPASPAFKLVNTEAEDFDHAGQRGKRLIFELQAIRTGAHTIEGARLSVDDQVKVLPSLSVLSLAATPNNAPVPTEGAPYFLELEVDKDEIYLGEPIRASYFLYRPANAMPEIYDQMAPNFTGFWAVDIKVSYATKNIQRAGRSYVRESAIEYFLVPIEVGTLNIAPTRVKVPNHNSLYAEPSWIASPSKALQIKPLPPGAPAGFDLANVGHNMSLSSTVRLSGSNQEATPRVGDSLVFSAQLSGEGLVEQMVFAPLAEHPDLLSYGPEREEAETKALYDLLSGSQRVSYTVVPLTEGELTVPPLRFVFFDPQSEAYQELTAGPWTFEVKGKAPNADKVLELAKKGTQPFDAFDELNMPAPNLRSLNDAAEHSQGIHLQEWWVLLALSFPPLLFGALIGLRRYQASGATRAQERQLNTALSRANRALKGAQKSDLNPGLKAIEAALNSYFSDRWQLSWRALGGAKLCQELRQRGLSTALVEALDGAIRDLSEARYAGASASQKDELAATFIKLLNAVDKELK